VAPTSRRGRWLFLGVLVEELTGPTSPVTVAEAVLPGGASPPAHVHAGLDDSFYVLEGHMVVRCGDDVFEAGPGSWVQLPAAVPHTFRVLDGPARILLVHADDSFLAAVRRLGRPAVEEDVPTAVPGPSVDELTGVLAEHGITNVGPCMEPEEAAALLRQVAAAGAR
jgi:quercetin dioxygenase-like cupin family protein